MCKFMAKKYLLPLATVLAAKRSAGVATEVNLRNPLHAGKIKKTWKQVILNNGFETDRCYHKGYQQGYQ